MNKITPQDIEQKLKQRNLNSVHKSLRDFPHFSLMKDMDKATDIIIDSMAKNEVLTLCGDYDCDGVISTVIIKDFFDKIGYPLNFLIPNRFSDGYGLSASVLEKINYTDTLITVDNGIVAFEAAEICKQRNIKLIITDHHTVGDRLPDCSAIVNPKQEDCLYPYSDICGAEVAFLLCCSIKVKLNLKIDMGQFLDLLAVAVVADVMPLNNINREIVRKGIQLINSKKRDFFKNLLQITHKTRFTMMDIGFQISPRLNSAGRLANAEVAVKAILASGEDSYARVLELDDMNTERKTILTNTLAVARELIEPDAEFNIIASDGLHEGVVGIVASKICEDTIKPTLILSKLEDGSYKGSGRSVGDVNIYELVKTQAHLLTKFGGHKAALGCGLVGENLEEFKAGLQIETAKIDRDLFNPKEAVFGVLDANDISTEVLDILEKFAPYGEANPQPIFRCENVSIIKVDPLGGDGIHVKIFIDFDGCSIGIPLFNTDVDLYRAGDMISFNYALGSNEWKGNITAQMMATNIEIISRRVAA